MSQASSQSPARTPAPCKLCAVAESQLPVPPKSATKHQFVSSERAGWHVVLATKSVVAVLDPMPLVKGQLLVFPRQHRHKLGDMLPHECAEIYSLQPLLVNAMLAAVYPNIKYEVADYNHLSANGLGAAQDSSHVSFSIVPRPPNNYTSGKRFDNYPPEFYHADGTLGFDHSAPTYKRKRLDHADAKVLEEEIRHEIRPNWKVGGDDWDNDVSSGDATPTRQHVNP